MLVYCNKKLLLILHQELIYQKLPIDNRLFLSFSFIYKINSVHLCLINKSKDMSIFMDGRTNLHRNWQKCKISLEKLEVFYKNTEKSWKVYPKEVF